MNQIIINASLKSGSHVGLQFDGANYVDRHGNTVTAICECKQTVVPYFSGFQLIGAMCPGCGKDIMPIGVQLAAPAAKE